MPEEEKPKGACKLYFEFERLKPEPYFYNERFRIEIKAEGDCTKKDLSQNLWAIQPIEFIRTNRVFTRDFKELPPSEKDLIRNMLDTAGNPDFKDEEIETFHVSDDISRILEGLEKGLSVAEMRPTGTLGGGLYGSALPTFWYNRSPKYQAWWENVPPEDRERLFKYFWAHDVEGKYASVKSMNENEIRNFKDFLTRWKETGDKSALYFLRWYAPYVVPWENAFQELNIKPPKPKAYPMHLRGAFFDATNASASEVLNKVTELFIKKFYPELEYDLNDRAKIAFVLKELGYEGMFTKMGYGSAPEMVVWDNNAICRFNNWINKKSEICAREKEEELEM